MVILNKCITIYDKFDIIIVKFNILFTDSIMNCSIQFNDTF